MKSFDIADLERFSGIKAHTLRAWQQRYGAPVPLTQKGQKRRYPLTELLNLLGLTLLYGNGYKISRLTALSKEEMAQKLKGLMSEEDRRRKAVFDLVGAMYQLDQHGFEFVLDNCFLTWPAQTVLQEVIFPFLIKTNLFWQGTRQTEEHLVVTITRQKMLCAIQELNVPLQKKATILLFLTDTKQLDLALLYACFFLRHQGHEVVYMGNDVSIDCLATALETINPAYLYTYLPQKNNFPFARLIAVLKEKQPRARLIVTVQPSRPPGAFLPEQVLCLCFDEALQRLCR